MVRISWQDPGRRRDFYGFVAADVDTLKIKILNAKFWYKTDTTMVADDIAAICRAHPFKYNYCEANNAGHVVIDLLKRYHHLYVQGITTTKKLTDPEKIRQGKSMDKHSTVEWVEWARNVGIIEMPKKPWSKGIIELNKQLARFVSKETSSGVKYEAAESDDHDDGVMCLVGLAHVAKLKFLRLGHMSRSIIASGITMEQYQSQGDADNRDALEIARERLRKRGLEPDNIDMGSW